MADQSTRNPGLAFRETQGAQAIVFDAATRTWSGNPAAIAIAEAHGPAWRRRGEPCAVCKCSRGNCGTQLRTTI